MKVVNLKQRLSRYWNKLMGLNDFYFPPGHYYSPLSSREEIDNLNIDYFKPKDTIPAIALNSDIIKNRLLRYAEYYDEFKTLFCSNSESVFKVNNGYYSYSDAIFLFSVLKEIQPARYFEIGSGYSSILTIQTDLLCLGNNIEKKFIEPYPSDRLLKMLKGDEKKVEVICKKVQDVPLELFERLEANDVLFIDSSHVSKLGSDLNYIIFNILPILKTGVLIHFHDIFYPFEYPQAWVRGNRWHSWNEVYLLRAFLMY